MGGRASGGGACFWPAVRGMAWQGVVLNMCVRDEVAQMLGVDNHVCEVKVVPRGGGWTDGRTEGPGHLGVRPAKIS